MLYFLFLQNFMFFEWKKEKFINLLQALLQARLGAYLDSSESGEASEGEVVESVNTSKEKKEITENKPELISLLDDTDSGNESQIKTQIRRFGNLLHDCIFVLFAP